MFHQAAAIADAKYNEGYFSSRTSGRAPEARLMLAVLQDALVVFYRGLDTKDPVILEAYREVDWWFRDRDFDPVFSFENVCSALGISADCVRNTLNDARRTVRASEPAGYRRPPNRSLR